MSDLLNYGRPTRLAVEKVDLSKLVTETIELVRPQADDQGVDVEVEGEGNPAEILGDRGRLKSCFSNLALSTDGGLDKALPT